MQDIRQVIRRKQAQQVQLSKEIELLLQAEQTLLAVAPLLADTEEDDNAVLAEVDEEFSQPKSAAKAAVAPAGNEAGAAQADPSRPLALRWP